MKNECPKDDSTSKLGYVCYCVGILILLIISMRDINSYKFIIIIIRSALSLLIMVLIINNMEKENNYIRLIGIGYIVSNMIDILGFLVENQQNIDKINILSSSLETIIFLIVIKGLINKYSENNCNLKKNTFYTLLFTSFILILNTHFTISSDIKISEFTIIYLLNLILLIIGVQTIHKCNKINRHEVIGFNLLNKLLVVKIIFFMISLFLNISNIESNIIQIALDILSTFQIYLVYKLVIQNALLNPYIKIKDINEEIINNTKKQEQINLLLEKIKNIEYKIEEKILYKDEFFKSILSSTPNGWLMFDENLKITYYNKSFKKIINHSEGDILESIEDNIVDYDKFIDNMSKAQKQKLKIEDSIRTVDNKIYKCIYMGYKEQDECTCLIFEITKEVTILDNLINLKQEYEDLIRNIKTPVFICDGYNNIVDFSKSYELTFDKYKTYISENNKKLYEESYFKIMHPDDKEMVKNVFKINQQAKSNKELYNNGIFKFRIINKKNEIIWLESKTTVYYEGESKYNILSYIDISKYVESKEYLERTQDMYKGVLDSIPEGIYLENIESGKYIFINDKFKEIFSYNLDKNNKYKQSHKNNAMTIHPDYSHVLYKGIENVKHDRISEFDDIKYIDKSGKIIEAKVASVPFKINNNIFKLSVIKTMEDINKLEDLKKKIIEREKHDKMKMEFFINMSHELKTPLNLIFTSTQLIESLYNKNKLHGNSIENHINLTKQNSYRLLKIINDLIEFTKMETGSYNVHLVSKDVISVIEDIVMSVVDYAKVKGVEIIFDTEIEELIMAVDVTAIEIIVLNLLSNAIKFTNQNGYIYVDIIYREDTNQIDIIIKDTGIGIEKDKLNLIFKRFNNVNKGFIGNVNGSGIGLSMVRSMAKLIDAKITVESEYTKGSTFTITLNIIQDNQCDYCIIKDGVKRNEPLNVERLVIGVEDIYSI